MAYATVYEHIDFAGERMEIEGHCGDLQGWNNRASSIIVHTDNWIVFGDDAAGSDMARLVVKGPVKISDLTRLEKGRNVTFDVHIDVNGFPVLDLDVLSFFDSNWNDEICSVEVHPPQSSQDPPHGSKPDTTVVRPPPGTLKIIPNPNPRMLEGEAFESAAAFERMWAVLRDVSRMPRWLDFVEVVSQVAGDTWVLRLRYGAPQVTAAFEFKEKEGMKKVAFVAGSEISGYVVLRRDVGVLVHLAVMNHGLPQAEAIQRFKNTLRTAVTSLRGL